MVPLETSTPRGCRLSSEAISVSLPTEVVDDRHALAIGELADTLGNVLARRHDRMGAAVRLGGLGLCIGADDRRSW